MRGPLVYLYYYIIGNAPIDDVIYLFLGVLVFMFVCIPIHECAHALAAKALGDDTAERAGRLTLNPFDHIDLYGAVMMFMCCIGWAKPTPVNLGRCKKVSARTANVIVSLAGPLANILMAFLFVVISKVIFVAGMDSGNDIVYQVYRIMHYIAMLNCYIAVFNLLPIPGFDGWSTIESFLPLKALRFVEQYGFVIRLIMLMLLLAGILSIPVGIVSNLLMMLFDLATRFII